MTHADRLQSIYLAAAGLPSENIHSYLDLACGGDASLRETVEKMLSARSSNPRFMASPTTMDTLPVPVEALTNGSVLGRYRLLDRLGEGGFGTVFLAEQREPVVRRVAIKMLHEQHTAPNILARFEAERQALALMEHPHIARILDAGSDESGRPYFVMELVIGRPIAAYCDQHKLTIRERLELFEQVCHAAQHAHTKGIIHRDLKPNNILVAPRDGRHHATVIDFGIAKATQMRLTPRTLFTADRAFVGTPEYMSPEQVNGSPDIDTRTDVYSLGALLYELLVGSPPFGTESLRQAGFIEIVRHIREIDPPRPSAALTKLSADGVRPKAASDESSDLKRTASERGVEPKQLVAGVRGELDVIAMKALEKIPSRRYQTASELAQDVRRHLEGNPISAVPHTAWYWASKFARKHRPIVATLGTSVAAILALAVVLMILLHQRNEALDLAKKHGQGETEAKLDAEKANKSTKEALAIAQASGADAMQQRVRAERAAYRAKITIAQVTLERGPRRAFNDAIAACNANLRAWEWDYLSAQGDRSVMTLRGHRGGVTGAVFLRGGSLAATASDDGLVRIFEAASGRETRSIESNSNVVSLVATGDGRLLAATVWGAVLAIDPAAANPARIVLSSRNGEAGAGIVSLAWDQTNRIVAIGRADGIVELIADGDEPRALRSIRAFNTGVSALAFSGDGRALFAAGAGGGVRVFDTANGDTAQTLTCGAVGIAPLPGDRLATVDGQGVVQVWDLSDTERAIARYDVKASAYSIAASPDSSELAVACADGAVLIGFDGGLRRRAVYKGHSDAPTSIAFSPDGRSIITGSGDGTARIWSAADTDDRLRHRGSMTWSDRPISPDGAMLAVVRSGRVEVRDVATGELISIIQRPGLTPDGANFTPDGRSIVVHAYTDHRYPTGDSAIFDALTGELISPLRELRTMPPISPGEPLVHADGFHNAVFSPAADRVAVAARSGWRAEVYDWRSGQKAFSLTGHTDGVRRVSFSPNGKRVLTESTDGTARLWDAADGRHLATLDGHGGPVLGSVFSENGRFLLTIGSGGRHILWRVSEESISRVAESQRDDLADGPRILSADGKLLLIRSSGEIHAVETANGRTVSRVPMSDPDAPDVFCLTPDSKQIVTLSADRQVEVWDVQDGERLIALGGHESRPDTVALALNGSAIVTGDRNWVHVWDSRSAIERAEGIDAFSRAMDEAARAVRSRLAEGAVPDAIVPLPRTGVGFDDRASFAARTSVFADRKSPIDSPRSSEPQDAAAQELSEARINAERENNSAESLHRLGAAYYGVGEYEEALAVLYRSERREAEAQGSTDDSGGLLKPGNGGFIVMSLWKLGRKEEANAMIEMLRALIAESHTGCDCGRYLDAALLVVGRDGSMGTEE